MMGHQHGVGFITSKTLVAKVMLSAGNNLAALVVMKGWLCPCWTLHKKDLYKHFDDEAKAQIVSTLLTMEQELK